MQPSRIKEPPVPRLLTPFSDLCPFNDNPNLLTCPWNPLPFVTPLTSTIPVLKTS